MSKKPELTNDYGYLVRIIEDSFWRGSRLTTLQLTYPRFVHAEFMTHRVFSRNASSSRAIPVKKQLERIENFPATPVEWGKNQAGMQAKELLDKDIREQAIQIWHEAKADAVEHAQKMEALGVHKQIVNRLTEPFQFISVVMTSSKFGNWEELRCHEDAQPEIQALAYMMRDIMGRFQPKELTEKDYHLPYITAEERKNVQPQLLTKYSVARCARVSYLTHDNEVPKPEDDLALYERLVGSTPLHASPTEHQARPYGGMDNLRNTMNGNFDIQWLQYRKLLELKAPEVFYMGGNK